MIQFVTSWDWPFSLKIIWRLTQVGAGINRLFLYIVIVILLSNTPGVLSPQVMERLLSCVQFGAIINKAATNIYA